MTGTLFALAFLSALNAKLLAVDLLQLGTELTRSDLSVQQQDHVRAALSDPAAGQRDRPEPPS
jgi:hypothetical protein